MTLAQIVAFWSFFLFVVPYALRYIERRLLWPSLGFTPHMIVAGLLFAAFSGLGLWSGITMARNGAGTPLPLDATNRLVVCGPYAHVRNPMAIAGLGQGASVGLGLGSGLVLAYVLLGSAIWEFLVRPSEERDMHDVFGDEFPDYRRSVPCWRPRLAPYHAKARLCSVGAPASGHNSEPGFGYFVLPKRRIGIATLRLPFQSELNHP